ncbi:S9 family peptidase [Ferrimonas lipolytica]|uniref:S9 family peptidase n=2 Tax=Ferrimonas lipolytica TaxID=2724191 RepID=A0A6H1UID2_9GAMM|nr:S9 family peptidase [Ferrimonas lipolytica]
MTPLTLTDVFALEYAAEPQISPDGRQVVYERRSYDVMSDASRSNLWQLNIDGSAHQPLLSGAVQYRQPRFSPDGERLAYLSSVEGSTQLYVRWLTSGNTARIADLTASPSSLSWSPDGHWLAFSMFTPAKPSRLAIDMPQPPKGADWADSATYIDSVRYRSDGGGYHKSGQRQIYIVPSDGGTPTQLTSGDYPHGGGLVWSADSSQIIFAGDRHSDWQMRSRQGDIFTVDITTKKISALTNHSGVESSPALSPNGKLVAYLQLPDSNMSHVNPTVFVMNVDGSDKRELTPTLDRPINKIQWSDNGKSIYLSFVDHGTTKVALVTLKGKLTTLDVELGGQSLGRPYASGDFTAADGKVVFTGADSHSPADLSVVNTRGKIKQLTQLNQDLWRQRSVAPVQSLELKSSVDGRAIDAWVALPPNFDATKRYPLILEIHGGPHAAYGANFSMEVQLMAAQGYVVVWANPRGSSSYGSEFANLIHHNYPSEDYNDLMDVVDVVQAKGYIDEEQLFVTGGSGGGTLTAWIVGKTDRFRAAVVAKPVINWMSFTLTADMYPYFSQYWMSAKPWTIADHLWQHSPLSLVGNVTTPTMLLTGEVDYRTPISETEQYYQALQLNHVDTAMVRIPGASHGITARPSNLMQKVAYILAWFDKYSEQ